VQNFLRSVQNGKKLPAPPKSPIIQDPKWVPPSSDTEQIVQDLGILYKYKRYLLKWEEITDNLLKSVDPAARKKRTNPKKEKGGRQKQEQRDRRNNNPQQRRREGGRNQQRRRQRQEKRQRHEPRVEAA
jgi:hypothetical protein